VDHRRAVIVVTTPTSNGSALVDGPMKGCDEDLREILNSPSEERRQATTAPRLT